jgi:hypothetical protein
MLDSKRLEVAEEVILTQVKFYRSLVKKPLQFTFEEAGSLDEKTVAKNKAIIEDILKNYEQPVL